MQSRGPWRLLTHTVVVNFMFGGFGWYYIILMVAEVRSDLNIGVGEWGVLWSGISLGVLLSSIAGGALGDRFGVRHLVASGLVISGGALLGRAAADRFPTMLLTMILFGIGLGIASANVPKALGTWFPPNKLGLANGLALAGIGAGQACAALLTIPVANRLGGWRTLTLLLGVALFVLALYWWLTVRDAVAESSGTNPAPQTWPTIARVIRVKEIWGLALCYALFLGGLLGMIGYLHTFLTTVRGLNPELAAIVISLAPWTFVVGSALMPGLSDRVGLRRTVYSTAIAASAVAAIGHIWLDGFSLALASASFGLCAGAVGILFVVPVELKRVGPDLAGTAIGVVVSAGFLGGAVFPVVGMRLAEARPAAGLACFSLALLLSAVVFALLRAPAPRHASTR